MVSQCSSMFESRGFEPVNSACFNAKEPSRELGWIDILLLMSNKWSYDGLMRRKAGVQGFQGSMVMLWQIKLHMLCTYHIIYYNSIKAGSMIWSQLVNAHTVVDHQ